MPQIEKPDELQSIANQIRFFSMHDAFNNGNSRKESGGKFIG